MHAGVGGLKIAVKIVVEGFVSSAILLAREEIAVGQACLMPKLAAEDQQALVVATL